MWSAAGGPFPKGSIVRINKKVAVLVATAAAGASLLVGAGVSSAGTNGSYCGGEETFAARIISECCGGVHSSGLGAPVACRSRPRHSPWGPRPENGSYGWENLGGMAP